MRDALDSDLYPTDYSAMTYLERGVREIKTLYRYFPCKKYADKFELGELRLSTLRACRETGDDTRRDAGEGTLHRRMDHIDGRDPRAADVLRQTGLFSVPDNFNALFKNCHAFVGGIDGYLLCTSEILDDSLFERWGKFCVRINRPVEFFFALTQTIGRTVLPLHYASIGTIKYIGRELVNYENAPSPIAFLKPTSYVIEKEVRMFWRVKVAPPGGLRPHDLTCPDAAQYCERIA